MKLKDELIELPSVVFRCKCHGFYRHNFRVTLSNVEQVTVDRIDLMKSSEDFDEGHLNSDPTICLTTFFVKGTLEKSESVVSRK